MTATEAEARVGTWIREKYRIDRVLGEGGMAIVYAATHKNKKRFAIKMLRRAMSGHDETRARFVREGYVANTVAHPAAVAVLDEDVAEDGSALLHFHGDEPVELLLERAGRMPLPPYIASKRPADAEDRADYQTMFAREEGAVAAPTAALHFTPELLEALDERGIGRETLTLHVGAGTFLPVKADDTSEHKMHAEWGRIDAATAARLNAARASGGRLIAVGTTSLRLLESAAGDDGTIHTFEGDTAIFITPGYRFKAIDGLVTNFHLPRSTLFMLVSALMGLDVMKAAYGHAIDAGYRFYSYGDASLLLPKPAE